MTYSLPWGSNLQRMAPTHIGCAEDVEAEVVLVLVVVVDVRGGL